MGLINGAPDNDVSKCGKYPFGAKNEIITSSRVCVFGIILLTVQAKTAILGLPALRDRVTDNA